ncbi:MAG: hypothetical protein JWM68_97 [Verrucomicrobiales bacterium]|nr:hypothetical protein [Verrucomicrobiales bacterium]
MFSHKFFCCVRACEWDIQMPTPRPLIPLVQTREKNFIFGPVFRLNPIEIRPVFAVFNFEPAPTALEQAMLFHKHHSSHKGKVSKKPCPTCAGLIPLIETDFTRFKTSRIAPVNSFSIQLRSLCQISGRLHKDKVWYQTLSSPLHPLISLIRIDVKNLRFFVSHHG